MRLTKETEQVEQTKPWDQPEIDSPHELLVLREIVPGVSVDRDVAIDEARENVAVQVWSVPAVVVDPIGFKLPQCIDLDRRDVMPGDWRRTPVVVGEIHSRYSLALYQWPSHGHRDTGFK